LKIQRIGRGKIVRQQDRKALAASSTVTKAEAREERQREIAERKAKASKPSTAPSAAQLVDAGHAAAATTVHVKKAATLDDIIDLAPLLSKPELGEWNRDLVSLEHAVTFDVTKRGNLKMIDEHTVLSVCGSRLLILDVATMSQRFFPSVSGRGVGCVAVHPNRSVFAVGEKGAHPFIVVYALPFPQFFFVTLCPAIHGPIASPAKSCAVARSARSATWSSVPTGRRWRQLVPIRITCSTCGTGWRRALCCGRRPSAKKFTR
jgi:hypothetical protein